MRLGIMNDPIFLKHLCGSYDHPECPERLSAALRGINSAGNTKSAINTPAREATRDELVTVHTPEYVSSVLSTLEQGGYGHLDPDTFYSPDTLAAALKAVGGGIDLALAVQKKDLDLGVAIVRPPGHHASRDRSMGFCIFNNIAAAAAIVSQTTEAKRVVIFDWDVHHGNGTQDQFWNNPDVLYISIHQAPFYPGTGHLSETGSEKAPGTTANIPLPAGATDDDYLLAMDKIILPLINDFKPGHIMVSAGFDAHESDPLASMRVSTDCYREMAGRMKLASDNLCDGRLTMFLEGGYSLDALEQSMSATMNGFLKPTCKPTPDWDSGSQHQSIIRKAIESLIG